MNSAGAVCGLGAFALVRPRALAVSTARLRSRWWPVRSPRSSGCSAGFSGGSSSFSGLFHPVAVAVGDHDVAVVQEPIEHADRGGVLGQEPAPGLERPVLAAP